MFFSDTWTLYFMYTEGNLNIHVISQIWMCQFWFCWKNKDMLWHLTLFTANHWWFSLKVVKKIFLYHVALFLESQRSFLLRDEAKSEISDLISHQQINVFQFACESLRDVGILLLLWIESKEHKYLHLAYFLSIM